MVASPPKPGDGTTEVGRITLRVHNCLVGIKAHGIEGAQKAALDNLVKRYIESETGSDTWHYYAGSIVGAYSVIVAA